MSDSTASLRHQIDSADDLASVVRTMKALAASNIVQYEKSTQALDHYYQTVESGLSVCFRQSKVTTLNPPGRSEAAAAVVDAVIFGSDQGLVGQFNERIAEHALKSLAALPAGPRRVWAVGERLQSRLADTGVPLTGLFTVPTSLQEIGPLIGRILVETDAGGSDETIELHLFYNHPTGSGDYEAVGQRLLPLDERWRRTLAELPWPTHHLPQVMGDMATALRALIREYLFISLFRACTDSLASENASRLAAMQRAEKNIDERLDHLRGKFHRLRQSSIDEELFDVIAGFEALSGMQQSPLTPIGAESLVTHLK